MSVATPSPAAVAACEGIAQPWARLAGLGCATPPLCWRQEPVAETMIELWRLGGAAAERFRRIVAATRIETRQAVAAPAEVVRLSTAQRMQRYEREAPPLAAQAARRALRSAGLAASAVTDLVVVSCTGFSAPGVDVALVERLGLCPGVRRTTVGFMGCYGAIIGLRVGLGAALASPRGVVLVVCVELCSLHVRDDRDLQNQVATALFADGAAAAVVTGADRPGGDEGAAALGRLTRGRTCLMPEGQGWMSWRVTDRGFRMTLSRDVPGALRGAIRGFIDDDALDAAAPTLVVHPGGPEILEAVDEGLGLGGGRGLPASWSVLRRYGNMSSATVLFVLAEALRAGWPLPMLLVAFGPGLAVETVRLDPQSR